MPVDNIIFHDVRKLCRFIIEPEWSIRVTGYRRLTLYDTYFSCCCFRVVVSCCCCYCLLVVCVVYSVITSSLYCSMSVILYKKNYHYNKRSAYFRVINLTFPKLCHCSAIVMCYNCILSTLQGCVGIQESPTLENREKEKQEKTKGEEN